MALRPRSATVAADEQSAEVEGRKAPEARRASTSTTTDRDDGSEQVDGREAIRAIQIPDRRCLPFLEKDGTYWGPPQDDKVAIAELERLRQLGARTAFFLSHTLWWLDHYPAFHRHLRQHYPAITQSKTLLAFDLQPGPG